MLILTETVQALANERGPRHVRPQLHALASSLAAGAPEGLVLSRAALAYKEAVGCSDRYVAGFVLHLWRFAVDLAETRLPTTGRHAPST